MKILLLLSLIISCGKDTSTKKLIPHWDKLQSDYRIHEEENILPTNLSFKSRASEIEIRLEKVDLSGIHFFTKESFLHIYQPTNFGHIKPNQVYILENILDKNIQIKLYDNFEELTLINNEIQMTPELLTRLIEKKSYFFLTSKIKNANFILIENEDKVYLTSRSITDFLNNKNINHTTFSLESISSSDHYQQWWLHQINGHTYKLIFKSANELNELLKKNFTKTTHLLRRINGVGSNLIVDRPVFIRLSGTISFQKISSKNIKKTFYTQKDALEVPCSYTETRVSGTSSHSLKMSEIRNFMPLGIEALALGTWLNPIDNILEFKLPDLKTGFHTIGVSKKTCPSMYGPRATNQKINTEKELELKIESYTYTR